MNARYVHYRFDAYYKPYIFVTSWRTIFPLLDSECLWMIPADIPTMQKEFD